MLNPPSAPRTSSAGLSGPSEPAGREHVPVVEEPAIPHPPIGVDLAERALAGIGHEHHDDVVGTELAPVRLHPLDGARHRHSARAAQEHALRQSESPRHVHGFLVGDSHVLVDGVEVHVASEDVSDAFGDVGEDLLFVELTRMEVLPVHRAVGIEPMILTTGFRSLR